MVSVFDELDETDKKIIELLQSDPNISHADIGKKINKSQPAVGARILKLTRKGFVGSIFGVNYKSSNSPLILINIESNNMNQMDERAERCPFILNIFTKTGQHNYSILATASSMDKYNAILDPCLRRDKSIQHIDPAIILKIKKDLIIPLNFNYEFYEKVNCTNDCPFKEKSTQITIQNNYTPIAESLAEFSELKIYFDKMLDAIMNFVKCDGIGIRLLDQKGTIQFYSWKGLKDDFFKSENRICINDCLCGAVCRGELDKSICTPLGSYVSNNLTESFASLPQDIKKGVRGRCNHEGYMSIALVPLKKQDKILGLLYLAAYRKDAFPDNVVHTIESFVSLITNAILTITYEHDQISKENDKILV